MQAEFSPKIIMHKWEKSAGDGASILALKPMGKVNQSPKQREPVAPQMVTCKRKLCLAFTWLLVYYAGARVVTIIKSANDAPN